MKKKILFWSFVACLLIGNSVSSIEKESLAQLYESGRMQFVQELEITDDSLPGELFFQNPFSLANHASGTVFIGDWGIDHLKVFSKEGEFQKTIGRKGQGPGEFFNVSNIEVSSERILVWEAGNKRISFLNLMGEYIKSIKFGSGMEFPMKIRALPDGKIVIGVEKQIEDTEGYLQQYRLDLYSKDLEYLNTLFEKKQVRAIRIRNPVNAHIPQPFNPQVYWDVTPDGKIVVGFSGDYRIEIYDPTRGRQRIFEHNYVPVKVTSEDRTGHFSKMTVLENINGVRTVKQGAPDYIVNNTKFPKVKSAFRGIIVDCEGNIWVFPHHKDRKDEKNQIDVFLPDGTFINRVRVDDGIENLYYKMSRMIDHSFWLIERNEETFQVVKYRISR
ncbi:6-bladed beta-propeller [Acidobacteriota bacterium]